MKAIRLIFFLGLGLFILYVKLATVTPPNPPATDAKSSSPASGSVSQPAVDGAVPQKVLHVLQIVRSTGQPPDGYVGGRVFQNREGHLPAGGDYREFDVDPHQGDRNAERIIVEWNTKKAWYTADHYQTFVPLP